MKNSESEENKAEDYKFSFRDAIGELVFQGLLYAIFGVLILVWRGLIAFVEIPYGGVIFALLLLGVFLGVAFKLTLKRRDNRNGSSNS